MALPPKAPPSLTLTLTLSNPTLDPTRLVSGLLAITFVTGWGIFPCNFVLGHSGFGIVSDQFYITMFVIGDLLSKNIWVAVAVWRNHLVDLHNAQQADEEAALEMQQTQRAAGKAVLEQIDVQRFEQESVPDWRGNPRLARRGSCSTLILNEVNAVTPERKRQINAVASALHAQERHSQPYRHSQPHLGSVRQTA